MATTRVGVYRSYYGPVPTDSSGQSLPKSQWPQKRAHSWVVRWFGLDGNRYSKSFESRKEAERFAETKQMEVRDGNSDPPKEILLKDFAKEHGELMKGNLAPKTLGMHLATMGLLADFLGWERTLDRISVRDIEKFRASRLQTGISASSANRELKTLKRIFNLAVVRGYLTAGNNPCLAIPMIKVGRKKPPYCSPDEFQTLCQMKLNPLWQTLLVVTYTTALRLREALNLTWNDVDFAAGQVHVTRKNPCGFVQSWTPKDHEMRSIPLPEQAVALLAAWQSMAPDGCPYVFMDRGRWEYYQEQVAKSHWGSSRDLVNNILRRFKTICRRAGIGPFTIHDLRRSCITNWARQLPIHVVQQLAGHSDITTTQQFYLSVQPEDLTKARDIQEFLLGKIPASAPTDQEMTNSGKRRCFPGRRGCQPKM